ncbi:hypothetical protein [Bradyrhizobium sp. dw_411]|uniref:hypothetical protein n=1 Tax=Bradyrhizobium sp. dw_411 TaxID=2720082 RepID=UPI001BCB5FCC|nr:hypothetical protein [Bradyrhizobium sp. dw_411]
MAALAVGPSGSRIEIFDKAGVDRASRLRKPLPQDVFCHALLAGGTIAIETLCPGIVARLVAAGARACDPLQDVSYVEEGARTPKLRSEYEMLLVQRPTIEAELWDRVRRLPNVALQEAKITDIVPCSDGRLTLSGCREPVFDAVIDASGRERNWPGLQGVNLPFERLAQQVGIEIVSAHFALPPDPDRRPGLLVFNTPPPQGRLGGQVMVCDEDTGQISLGWRSTRRNVREIPLSASFSAFAPDVAVEMAGGWRQISDTHGYRFGEAYYRRAANGRTMSIPYFAIGDAQMKTNPAFGLGASVAAISALKLCNAFFRQQDAVAAARTYAFETRRHLDTAWSLSTMVDGLYAGNAVGVPWGALNFMVGRLRSRFIRTPALARRIILSTQMVVHDRTWLNPLFVVPARDFEFQG